MGKQNKGITLIALIITIIVLLILAGITLSMVLGENGIIQKANLAKEKTQNSQQDEQEKLAELENKMDEIYSTTRTSYSETILFDGETLSAGTYQLTDDISNYKYLYILFEQINGGVASNTSKNAEIIKVENITKDNSGDLMHDAWNVDRIGYHFIDSGLVVDYMESSYPPAITQIIGIK